MDYGRFNYVAQPGDGARLVPMVGPYDKFAIEWGYKPILSATNPAEEKPELDRMASRQVNDPKLRFGSARFGGDPSQQSEDLGDDGVEATRFGLKNLRRVMGYLEKAATKPGEDYTDLDSAYGEVWGQFNLETGHVLNIVGGSVMTDYHAGHGDDVYEPVSRDRQRAAVKLLIDEVIAPPTWLVPSDLLAKLQPFGAPGRIVAAQQRVISGLLQDAKITRMLELEHRLGKDAYGAQEMLDELRTAIYAKLSGAAPSLDLYDRQLQRAYVLTLAGKLENKASDARPLAIGELKRIHSSVTAVIPKAKDRATSLHLDDLRRQIEEALMPKTVVTTEAPAAATIPGGRGPRPPEGGTKK
jgi:hypothetical protein